GGDRRASRGFRGERRGSRGLRGERRGSRGLRGERCQGGERGGRRRPRGGAGSSARPAATGRLVLGAGLAPVGPATAGGGRRARGSPALAAVRRPPRGDGP